jgi:hypothetical protein
MTHQHRSCSMINSANLSGEQREAQDGSQGRHQTRRMPFEQQLSRGGNLIKPNLPVCLARAAPATLKVGRGGSGLAHRGRCACSGSRRYGRFWSRP